MDFPAPEEPTRPTHSPARTVKAASDILAPLDGEIVEVNDALVDNPSMVNDDPTGEAWFFKMKVDDLSAVDAYMTEDEYKDFIGE